MVTGAACRLLTGLWGPGVHTTWRVVGGGAEERLTAVGGDGAEEGLTVVGGGSTKAIVGVVGGGGATDSAWVVVVANGGYTRGGFCP